MAASGDAGEQRKKNAGALGNHPDCPGAYLVLSRERLKPGLLLHLELGVDDIVLLARAAIAVAPRAARPAAASAVTAGPLARPLAAPVHVLLHRLGRRLQVAQRLPDRLQVVALGRLLDAVDGRLDRRPVTFGQLVAVLLQQLLDLPDHAVGLVARLG